MSEPASAPPSRPVSLFFGTLIAFVSIVLVLFLLQWIFGGPVMENRQDRLDKKAEVAKQQGELLEKYGISGNADAVFAKAAVEIQGRKPTATTIVVPGTATALKAAAPAAAAPATPAPAAKPVPAPAPAAKTAPSPVPAAPAAPTPTPAAPTQSAPVPAPTSQPQGLPPSAPPTPAPAAVPAPANPAPAPAPSPAPVLQPPATTPPPVPAAPKTSQTSFTVASWI